MHSEAFEGSQDQIITLACRCVATIHNCCAKFQKERDREIAELCQHQNRIRRAPNKKAKRKTKKQANTQQSKRARKKKGRKRATFSDDEEEDKDASIVMDTRPPDANDNFCYQDIWDTKGALEPVQ